MPKHLTGVGWGGGGKAGGPWKGRKFVACEVELLVVHARESNEKRFSFSRSFTARFSLSLNKLPATQVSKTRFLSP